MAEELQGLLNKINEEAIQKAEERKKEIIANAEKEAEKIIKDAKERASTIIKNAEEEAEKTIQRAKETIRQAARDVIIELNESLQERMRECLKDLVSKAMTPELMADIIKKMAAEYIKDHKRDVSLKLILPQNKLNEIVDRLRRTLANSFKKNPEIFGGRGFSAGIKVGFKGSDLYFDFSDEAIVELISEYVGPRLASLLK